MRVIAGSAKGMKLKRPSGISIRPTSDRVKEALFSIIGGNLIGSTFVDLYAGSGAIGIEAISRGVDNCIFVDNDKNSINLINENLDKTKLKNKGRVIFADAKKALLQMEKENTEADIIFLDPPYNITNLREILTSLLNSTILSAEGLIVVEHDRKNHNWIDSLPVTKQKVYGDTCLSFFCLKTKEN